MSDYYGQPNPYGGQPNQPSPYDGQPGPLASPVPLMETASATTSPDNQSGSTVYVVAAIVFVACLALANSFGGLIERAIYEAMSEQDYDYSYDQPLDTEGLDGLFDATPQSYDL